MPAQVQAGPGPGVSVQLSVLSGRPQRVPKLESTRPDSHLEGSQRGGEPIRVKFLESRRQVWSGADPGQCGGEKGSRRRGTQE